MKKLIFLTGVASANLLMAGCLLKIFYWPGASILLVLSVALFSFVFLPSALLAHYRQTQKAMWLHVVTFLVFCTGMVSILFRIQHWPGATPMLLLSIPLPFVLFLPVYLYQTRHAKKADDMNALAVLFGLAFIAVFSSLLVIPA